jgi:ribonuclease P protein subunit POP4
MPLTPATLPRHELIGLDVAVAAASNPDLVGVTGQVVQETTKTLTIEGEDAGSGRVWQVPKADATFEFDLDGQTVTVEGERLEARPARRTERTGDSKWR